MTCRQFAAWTVLASELGLFSGWLQFEKYCALIGVDWSTRTCQLGSVGVCLDAELWPVFKLQSPQHVGGYGKGLPDPV